MNPLFAFLMALYLSFNYQQGSVLELTDGSCWAINPDDTNITSLWLIPMQIDITTTTKNPEYPFILKNLQTKQTVQAKKYTQSEETTPPVQQAPQTQQAPLGLN